ncbi:MAG: hypothetical protein K2N38_09760 [Oscillospiraceae bacterium]|nr:hypothetical protein [Oscillospiraceae bacterium]
MKNKKEILQTREEKLANLLIEMNADRHPETGKLVVETECTMARIRAYSDFLYALRIKPLQTVCYYAAGFFFLLTGSAIWTREWVLTIIFGVVFLVFATLPHNMKIWYFNKNADSLEKSYGKIQNAEFADDKLILRELPPKDPDSAAPREAEQLAEFPYKSITLAVECAHSFYLFPEKAETIICDKTLFLAGTPMGLRDHLTRKLGKKFKLKTKIKS